MPLYEYECQECSRRTEVLQRFGEAPKATCDQCGGELKKLLSAPAVQFKGSGWYVTDYGAKKPAASRSESSGSGSESSGSGSESSGSESSGSGSESSKAKPDSKGESAKPASTKTDKGGAKSD